MRNLHHEMGGIGWSVNLWMGSIVLSGIIGLLLSYLLLPPLVGEKETDPTIKYS